MAPRISADEKRWQREDDARTLARAEEIYASPARKNAALKEAKIIAARQEKELSAIKRVAAKTVPKNKKSSIKVSANKTTSKTISKRKR